MRSLRLCGELLRMIEKGYVHVYTGSGKGKTTAALGLALRAVGAGLNIFIAQFLKSGNFSELAAFKKLSDNITIRQYGSGKFVFGKPSQEDLYMAKLGLKEASEAIQSGRYQVLILDEANVAASYDLIRVEDILNLIDTKPDGVELIITGRGADQRIIEKADLVTEMREIKHYYQNGVTARKGIEK